MKIGVKIWPENADYAFEIAEHADFIEIMAKRGADLSFLSDIDMPFIVHAEHSSSGVNCADSAKQADAKASVDFAMKLADKLEARVVIVHPGFLSGLATQNMENVVGFFSQLKDNRILIENMALGNIEKGFEGYEYPFSTPDKLAWLSKISGKGICLDLSHAQVTAATLGINYMEILEKFIELRPGHFHACGGVEGKQEDMHLHLWEGDLNIDAFKRLLPKTAWVTLETPINLEGQIKDIEIMRK